MIPGLQLSQRCHEWSHLPLVSTCPILLGHVPERSSWLTGRHGLSFARRHPPAFQHGFQPAPPSALCSIPPAIGPLASSILTGGQRHPCCCLPLILTNYEAENLFPCRNHRGVSSVQGLTSLARFLLDCLQVYSGCESFVSYLLETSPNAWLVF